MAYKDAFSVRSTLELGGKTYHYFSLNEFAKKHGDVSRLPFSIKVLLEAAIRQFDGRAITEEHVKQLATWAEGRDRQRNSFHPCSYRSAGLHRRTRRRRPGSDA